MYKIQCSNLARALSLGALTLLSCSALANTQPAAAASEQQAPAAAPGDSTVGADTDGSGELALADSEEVASPQIAPNVDLKEVAPMPEPVVDDSEKAKESEAAVEAPKSGKKVAKKTSKPSTKNKQPTPDKSKKKPSLKGDSPSEAEASVPDAQKFVILGSEVMPNTATRLAWSPSVAITGLSLPTPVLVINGAQPGPTLCLSAAVHGDELNGIEIVRRVAYGLEPAQLRGKLIAVPIVNLQGFQRQSRYLPDRRDMNRYFPGDEKGSLASRIAHSFFTEVIAHCDILVDLHTGSLRRSNLPQIRADMHMPQIAKLTEGFDKMVVVHSSGSDGMLRSAAATSGVIAVTMEVGESMRIQETEIAAGVNSLLSLMDAQNMYDQRFKWGDPDPVYYNSSWLRAASGGILFSTSKLGDSVQKGQVLGSVIDPITNASADLVSPFKGRILGMAVDQVVMPGFAAYHIGQLTDEASMAVAEPGDDEKAAPKPRDKVSEVDPEE